MKDLSVIIAASRPQSLAHVLGYVARQSCDGLDYEVVLVQEADDFTQFTTLRYSPRFRIFRQPPSMDAGATAHDRGIIESRGKYVVFWDDDNIYYPHALSTLYSTALGHDIGIARVRHQGLVIPSGPQLKAGDIDTMCFCVRKELAARVSWVDHGGRYSDFRWIGKLAGLTDKVNRSPLIVGEHL